MIVLVLQISDLVIIIAHIMSNILFMCTHTKMLLSSFISKQNLLLEQDCLIHAWIECVYIKSYKTWLVVNFDTFIKYKHMKKMNVYKNIH